jgi:transposase InsO family protein
MSNRKINNGYHAIFCAVEIGSRWAFCMPMKNIREEAVIDAFDKLFKASKKLIPVQRVVTDEGSEFVSNAVKRWMAEKGVAHRIP